MGNQVHKELDQTLTSESKQEVSDINDLKMIVFSDLHRGGGDGADDFLRCERIYNSVLDYYNSLEYRLMLLGDVEELWEAELKEVVKHHRGSLLKEKQFVDAGRYVRFYGNHDDQLKDDTELLRPFIGDYKPIRALKLSVTDNGQELGQFFFTHGDQGDHYGKVFRFALRYLWRGLQDLTKLSVYLPSRNSDLSKKNDFELYSWSAKQSQPLALIAGHTHHGVFMSETKADHLKRIADEMLKTEGDGDIKVAMEKAVDTWNNTPDTDIDMSKGVKIPANPKPTYFNTGCCAFIDGEITGLEIADGSISLVKWSGDSGMPRREVLRTTELKSLFERIRDSK